MTEQDRNRDDVIRTPEPEVLEPGAVDDHVDAMEEGLVSPEDIGSASRSCLAIMIMLVAIVFLICLFLLLQPFVD